MVAVTTARESQRCKELIENDALNYVAVSPLLAAKCVSDQGITVG